MLFLFSTASPSPSPEEVWTTAFNQPVPADKRLFRPIRVLSASPGLHAGTALVQWDEKTGGKWRKSWEKQLLIINRLLN